MLTCMRSDYLEIIGYSSLDLARYLKNRNSNSWYIILLSCRAVSHRSTKKMPVNPPTFDVEYMTCFEVRGHVMYLNNLISWPIITEHISKPLKIYCDNDVVRRFIQNNKCSIKSRYLRVKYIVLKEKIRDYLESIVGSPTDLMIVVMLPRALPHTILNMGLFE